MTDFLIYECRVAVMIAAFYMFYRLLLSRETLHAFNRVVLLSTAVLSLILPFCVITIHKTAEAPAVAADAGGIVMSQISEAAETTDYLLPAIFAIYLIGAATVLVRMVISITGAMKIIRSGRTVQDRDGIKIVLTDRDIAPFSFVKYIVISENDWKEGANEIVLHETAHIRCRHSADVLLVEIITALQWFNPAIWMLRSDLRTLHEYEADDAVLRSGANIKEYQYLLIKKAVGASGYSITNSFNHSTLKNRITMMLCKKSSLWSTWKALYIIPLMGLSLASSARTVTDYTQTDNPAAAKDTVVLNSVLTVKYTNNPAEKAEKADEPLYIVDGKKVADFSAIASKDIASMTVIKDRKVIEKYGKEAENGLFIVTLKKPESEKDVTKPDVMPKFNDRDVNAFSEYINMNLRYPSESSGYKSGTVVVGFTVGKDGKVKDAEIVRGVSKAIDEEVLRVVNSSPVWTLGYKNGEPIDLRFMFPVTFKVK